MLTVEEAAEELRIGRTRMYSLIASGELVAVKVGGSRRVPRDELVAYVKRLVIEQGGGDAEEAT